MLNLETFFRDSHDLERKNLTWEPNELLFEYQLRDILPLYGTWGRNCLVFSRASDNTSPAAITFPSTISHRFSGNMA